MKPTTTLFVDPSCEQATALLAFQLTCLTSKNTNGAIATDFCPLLNHRANTEQYF